MNLLIESLGYFFPFSMIDHAVHLGGMITGFAYYYSQVRMCTKTQHYIWMKWRYKFISWYRKFRPVKPFKK